MVELRTLTNLINLFLTVSPLISPPTFANHLAANKVSMKINILSIYLNVI